MKTKAPCKDCADRHPACHGDCQRYAAFLADARDRKNYLRMDPADAFTYQEAKKNKRRNGKT